jgi:PBP1b-binding outer membrane lipoprotein LpoB
MNKLAAATIIVLSLAACAQEPAPVTMYSDGDYVTGSRIPRRAAMPRETQVISRERIDDWNRPMPAPMPSMKAGF